jgi:hypothetical protein
MTTCWLQAPRPPPNRVKPIPIQLLRHVVTTAYATDDPGNHAIADMIIIAFFFLLCPGEYTGTKSDTCPFRLADVQLWIGSLRASATSMPLSDLTRATFGTLTFTSQKNGVRGEVIGLSRSGDPLFCPVLALQRRVTHLRQHHLQPIHRLQLTFTLRAHTTSPPPTSPPPFVLRPPYLAPRSVSFPPTSMPDLSVLPAPWLYSAPAWTATLSASWVAGVATKCFATFMSRPSLSCNTSPAA